MTKQKNSLLTMIAELNNTIKQVRHWQQSNSHPDYESTHNIPSHLIDDVISSSDGVIKKNL